MSYASQMARNIQQSKRFILPRRSAVFAWRRDQNAPAAAPTQSADILARVALLALVITTAFGTLGVALFIATTAGLIAIAPQNVARDLLRYWPLLLLSILALLSTFWSDSPERSLRAGLQLLLTCTAAIIICRRVGAEVIILMLFFGYVGLCVLVSPGIPFAMTHKVPLFNFFLGSKNQVAFTAHMLICLSLAIGVDRRQPWVARLLAGPAIAFALLILFLAQSAGAQTSLAITLLTFPAFLIFGRVTISLRIAILMIVLVAVGIALIFLSDLTAAWADFRLTVLKKDATLTGRTYLWDFAARLIAERPWLGRGYYAFWRQGNIDAEGLWRWGGIASRTGFNFHNAYLEMEVDLGWVGLGLFLVTCVGIAAAGFVAQLLRPSVTSACLLSLLIVLYLRSYTESGLIAPFNLLTLLWITTAVHAVDHLVPAAKVKDRGVRGCHSAAQLGRPVVRTPRFH